MRPQIGFGVCLIVALSASTRGSETEPEWLLPNFASRLSIRVRNDNDLPLKRLVTLATGKAKAVAPDFPGRLALAVLIDGRDSAQPGTIIASQSDDLDGDGFPDQFEFPVDLPSHSDCRVDVYYSQTLEDNLPWPKRVSAKHSFGYNREVVALESELVGYRMYGGFFLDFHGRKAGATGLWNDAAAYVPVTRDLGTGRDVFHIGGTLGLGGMFVQRAGRVYQPPLNVPTYAHESSTEIAPRYRVLAQGPLRAIVEATLERWTIEDDVFRVRGQYTIDAGESLVSCHLEVVPIRLAKDHKYEAGIGVRDLPPGSTSSDNGRLIVTGQQNARDGQIGISIYFDPAKYSPVTAIRTVDGLNRAIISGQKITPGESCSLEYSAAGAWSGSGIHDLTAHLRDLSREFTGRGRIERLTSDRTPHPEKVGAEPQ